MWTNLRLGVRRLVKDRGVSAAAICALALALAAVNTVFTLANGIFLRPLPFEQPDRVVLLSTSVPARAGRFTRGVSYEEWQDWRAAARSLSSIGLYTDDEVSLADDRAAPQSLRQSTLSSNMFDLIGRQPLLGRAFLAGDDAAGAPPVVLLGHRLWQSRYGGETGAIGRTVRVNGREATIVGVMPPGFAFPQSSEIWQPLSALTDTQRTSRTSRGPEAVGRLRPGITREQAAADLATVASDLAARYPASNTGVTPLVRDFRDRSVGRVRVVFTAFGLAVSFVLLIACANVANLLFARGLDRSREMSIRLSMGATRARLVGQLLVESAVLGGCAGLLGLFVSMAGVASFQRALVAAGDVPYWIDFSLDWRVIAFLVALSLAASILFGLMPALHTSRTALAAILADSGRASTRGPRGRQWHGALVVVQVALAIVLLTAAGLTLRDLRAVARVNIGIDSRDVTSARFTLPAGRYSTAESRLAFYRQLDERLAAMPGGQAVLATYPPFQGGEPSRVSVDGQPPGGPGSRQISAVAIGPRYFASLGSRPVRGREFARTDEQGVAIVNERLARLYFGQAEPLGRDIAVATPSGSGVVHLTIVGVAPNVRQWSTDDRDFDPVVYLPHTEMPVPFATILVRSNAGTVAMATVLRNTVNELEPDLALVELSSLDGLLDADRWESRMLSVVFGLVAALALTLATVGVYAVTAFAVSRRTREIGVRMALGARSRHVYLLVTRGAAVQVAAGIALGVAGAFAITGVLDSILSETSATDGATLAIAPVLLAGVTIAACLVPTRRAVGVDPAQALRAE
jgi:putative ABC transport system permease protein